MKLVANINLIDKSFTDAKIVGYKLYVQISKADIKLLVLDVATSTFIALKVYVLNDIYTDHTLAEKIQLFVKEDTWINANFSSTHIIFVNNRATIMPNALFNKDELATYHQYNFTPNETDNYYFDKFLNLPANNIYAVPDFIISCFDNVKNKHFFHFSTPLIASALLHAKNTNALSLIDVHVLPNSFQIIIIKNQQLALYNSFDYQTSEDFIYYLLFVLEQQKIDNKKVHIRLLGEVEKNSTIYTLLNTYINEVSFLEKNDLLANSSLKLSYIFDEISPTYYYSIFQQYLCE